MKTIKLLQESFSQGTFQVWNERPEDFKLIELTQTHSDCIVTSLEYKDSTMEADGLIYSYQELRDKNLTLAIKTADCLPILFLGEDKVGLIHAGWRGIQQKIHLSQKLITIKPQVIFIGPCIHTNGFEVSTDFKHQFPSSPNFILQNDKLYFNLVTEALSQLQKTFPNAKIYSSNTCTFENNDYNSYRRNKTKNRNFNIFRTRGIDDNK